MLGYLFGLIVVIIAITMALFKLTKKDRTPGPELQAQPNQTKTETKKQPEKQKQNQQKQSRIIDKQDCYINSYKGFKEIVDYQIKKSLIVIAAVDNHFKLYSLKQVNPKKEEKEFLYIMQKIDSQYPRSIALSDEGNQVAVGLSFDKTIEIYELRQKKFNKLIKFKDNMHDSDIIKLEIKKQQIISIELKNIIRIIDFKGLVLFKFSTNSIEHSHIQFINSQMFMASYLPTVQIYQLQNDKMGNPQIQKSGVLQDIQKSVKYVECSEDESMQIAIQKDNELVLYQKESLSNSKAIFKQNYPELLCGSVFGFNRQSYYCLVMPESIRIYDLQHKVVKEIEHNQKIRQVKFYRSNRDLYLMVQETAKLNIFYILELKDI